MKRLRLLIFPLILLLVIFSVILTNTEVAFAAVETEIPREKSTLPRTNIGTGRIILTCPTIEETAVKPKNPDTQTVGDYGTLWRKISFGDYCHDRCRELSNSARKGWPRLRCKTSCLRKVFYDYYYKCWLPNKDPQAIAEQERIKREKEAAYERWEKEVIRLQEVLIQGREKDVEFLNSTIRRSKTEETQLKNEKDNLNKVISIAQKKAEDFSRYHTDFIARLQSRIDTYNNLAQVLQREIEGESQALSRLIQWNRQSLDVAFSSTATVGTIKELEKEYAQKQRSNDFKVCQSRNIFLNLRRVRDYQAVTEGMADEYRSRLNTLDLAYFPQVKGQYENNINNIDAIISKMDRVYSNDLNTLLKDPRACDDFRALPIIFNLRLQGFDVSDINQRLGSVTDELEEKLLEIQTNYVRDEVVINLKRFIIGLEGEVADHIVNGRINDVRTAATSAGYKVKTSLESVRSSKLLSSMQLDELEKLGEEVVNRIQSQAKNKTTFPAAARTLVNARVNRMLARIEQIDQDLEDNAKALPVWEQGPKREVFELLDITSQRYRLPPFSTENDLLNYDNKLTVAESQLDSFESEIYSKE